MKKIISLLLALTMLAAMAAGCAGNGNETTAGTAESKVEVPASALEILNNIWALYGENDKFPVIGGDFGNPVDGAPGNYSLEDAEAVSYSLEIPVDQVANIDQAASLIHAMMTNNFTCGVFHLKEGVDASAFAETMYKAVQGKQWMCGMAEKVIVAVIGGEYVLMAYGVNDAMGPFETNLSTAYPDADVKYSEAVTG